MAPTTNTGYMPDDDSMVVMDKLAGRVVPASFSAPSAGSVVTKNRDTFNPAVTDQGKSNFCVRFAMCRAMEQLAVREGEVHVPFSPLFLGWHDAMVGDQGKNVGTQIYLSAAAANRHGVCSDDEHPWALETPHDYMQRMRKRPHAVAYAEAERHQVLTSYRVPNGDTAAIIAALERGLGVVFGTPIRESFYDTGDNGMVDNTQGAILGWHAMFIIDADVKLGRQVLVVDNPWSNAWGDDGTCYISMEAAREFRDLRVLTKVELAA